MEIDKIYYFTKEDCEKIRFLHGNRVVNKSHVKSLLKDLKKGDGEYFPPILVDINTFCIADGQHRLAAFKLLWEDEENTTPIRVLFYDYDSKFLERVIKMNNNQKKWTIKDYAVSNAKMGSEAILKLNEFCNSCPLLFNRKKNEPIYRYATALIFGKNLTNKIKKNELKVEEDEVNFGFELYGECEFILNTLNILQDKTGAWLESFFSAWYDIRTDNLYNQTLKDIKLPDMCDYIDYKGKVNHKREEWREIFKEAIWEAKK